MQKAIIFLFFFAILISGCVTPESGRYFEVVYQDPNCSEKCFDETLVLEDGLVFLKERTLGNDYEVSFCKADQGKRDAMFSFLEKNFTQSKFVECADCEVFHVFYNDGKNTFSSSIPVEQQTFEKQVYEMAKEICAEETDAELVHLIFGKELQYTDYHVFSNGIIVQEQFGLGDGELISSNVSKINMEEFDEIKTLITDEFFNSKSIKNNCPENGYFYGYIEAIIDGKHNDAFTCGDQSPEGQAFLKLVERFSQ